MNAEYCFCIVQLCVKYKYCISKYMHNNVIYYDNVCFSLVIYTFHPPYSHLPLQETIYLLLVYWFIGLLVKKCIFSWLFMQIVVTN